MESLTGYGYGYGYGSGSGDGSGYGDGDGSGYGSGSGDGSGYGSGYGYGSGSGYGDGYGSGSGDGDGDGSGDYWAASVAAYVDRMPEAVQSHVTGLREQGAIIALWRSGADGRACNGGAGQAVYAGLRQQVSGPLAVCTARGLHATYQPHHYSGERLWLVALFGEVQTKDDKLAALEREIIAEVQPQKPAKNKRGEPCPSQSATTW